MKHQEYLSLIEAKLPQIKQEDLLFWDLWCLNFVFERVSTEYKYYEDFKTCFSLLWQMNDTKNINSDILQNSSVEAILNFDEDDFEDLDDFDESDKAAKEFLEGLESILLNIEEESSIIYNAYENPINLIDTIIEGISILSDNTNEIYLNEINAQFKLVDDLIQNSPNYTEKDKNIYR